MILQNIWRKVVGHVLSNIYQSKMFLFTLLRANFHQNYQAAFGCCEHKWVNQFSPVAAKTALLIQGYTYHNSIFWKNILRIIVQRNSAYNSPSSILRSNISLSLYSSKVSEYQTTFLVGTRSHEWVNYVLLTMV